MQGRNGTTSKSSTTAFKQELLKNLLRALRARTDACAFSAMSVHERKRAVKSSADVAMAAARGVGARWPKAILAAAAGAGTSSNRSSCQVRSSRFRRVARRCFREKRRGPAALAGAGVAAASSVDVARRLVRRRTMALRKVIPGGDAAMDEASLLREAMDYVVHLRAQVDVLRRVSEAMQRSSLLSLRDRTPSSSMRQ
ncbi:hypothetical protein PR202_gb28080 [Eleusine coracana subsp. coracana]|uniref:IBH1-like N-terminal domain-containing protein n=1 Tax=Eleusine coracana subsp. coracana TaxID=191504 RepID=A0AAV5FW29_ELECO|nr:hypothetical protein QOZ80_6AG0546860 [Eleusine coracana subsp. coracana]GJN38991.1 hypothetical protein PR202_gb28080 [Eleusine coracana subsp. coracana]